MKFRFAEHARLMGRFDLTEPETPRGAWVNSAVFLRFSGPEIRLTAESSSGQDYVAVVLDGVVRNWIRIRKGINEYVIEQGLQGAEHTLEIHKRTGILTGSVAFRGFALPRGGSFLAPPAAKPVRLEYFGDSITDGAGIGHPHELREAPHLDDGYMSYAGISARMLNAEYHTMAICGIGVWQDAIGGRNGLPAHFSGTLGSGTERWDFSRYVPDGIVINLGQNDYSTPVDDEDYVNAYIGFVDEMLLRYGEPYIFCCVGTMNNNYLPGVRRVVEHFNRGGNTRVFVVDLGLIHPEVEGWGGGYHPGYQTHYRMGAELARFISERTGWQRAERPKTATDCVF